MEKTELSEAIERFCTRINELFDELGMTREQIEEALELGRARLELQKFDASDYNCEIYIDDDLREETREQNKLRIHHSTKTSQAATAKRKSRQPKGKAWSWNRIRSRPNTNHGYH